MLLIGVSDHNFMCDWLISGSWVARPQHAIPRLPDVRRVGDQVQVFLKFHRSFLGKNILIQSNLLYKLVNFIWVFVVDEFDEWLTLSPWDWSSRVRFSSNSSTTHFYFYCFLVLFIYIMVLLRNVVSFWISYLKMLQMLKNLFF